MVLPFLDLIRDKICAPITYFFLLSTIDFPLEVRFTLMLLALHSTSGTILFSFSALPRTKYLFEMDLLNLKNQILILSENFSKKF